MINPCLLLPKAALTKHRNNIHDIPGHRMSPAVITAK
jgi:hypothetical protein